MNMVDGIAKRNARAKVEEILSEISASFDCPEGWVKSWGPRFMGALVGKGQAPEFTAEQIGRAFDDLMQSYKYRQPPKPAHVAELARELRPLKPMQKQHTDPTPQRRWTDEERAANVAFTAAIMAKVDENAAKIHAAGDYGTPERFAMAERCKAELQAWIKDNAP